MTDTKKRFYWLKLKRDFFKRHDIRIVESMPNGKDYVLFYLKLLCESVDHDGSLRFSDQIPYSEDMLSTITNTDVDVVRSAIKIFTELGMMDLLDDGTIFMNEVNNMIGSAVDNDNANRQRRFRERQKTLELCERYESVTNNNESKSKRQSKSTEKNNRRFSPPSVDEVRAYCTERNNNVDPETFVDFYESKGWMVGKNKMKDWKAAVRNWERSRKMSRPNNKFNNAPERSGDMSETERLLLATN